MSRMREWVHGLFLGSALLVLVWGCGKTSNGVAGGESHFLSRCTSSCDDGLECIGRVCTKACVVGESSCADLHDDALCTADSIEAQGAVCDVACEETADCGGLGGEYSCDNGYCRPTADEGGADGQGGAAGEPGNSAGQAGKSDSQGASGGEAGQSPLTGSEPAPTDTGSSNLIIDAIQTTATNKIDLLFVIDNSISMADKQAFFAQAVPALLTRFTDPLCVSESGETMPGPNCETGFTLQFEAVDDIHVGVVTSSLGGHGGDLCSDQAMSFNPTQNDAAHLLPTVRDGLNSYRDLGFLAWDPAGKAMPPGEANEQTFVSDFAAQVTAAGEQGCGFEATLEAWYRFLVDPEPPESVVADMTTSIASVQGVDNTVLEQRAAFLRPDSLVGIVMLSDENDCSIIDGNIGWLTAYGGGFHMPPATAVCAEDPNDACCRSCALSESAGPPAGCEDLASDPGCAEGFLSPEEDSLNLRCYNQRQRFGWDLLYPVSRYSDALKSPTVMTRDDIEVQNPLFESTSPGPLRDPSLIFLAGIVGVPWQDIATEDSLDPDAPLQFLTAAELESLGRWPMLVPTDGNEPTDPFMIETPDQRSGNNPITGDEAGGPGTWNPINGHEAVLTGANRNDLQYACIFSLNEARNCLDSNGEDIQGCDCGADDLDKQKPLCEPGGGDTETAQYYAKAYPGTRQLEVLRDFGPNSIVSSICPKLTTGDTEAPSYGYNPAANSIVDRMQEALGSRCLPRELSVDEDGLVPCTLLEATLQPTTCSEPGRQPVDEDLVSAIYEQLAAEGKCDGVTGISCEAYSVCELIQLEGDSAALCKNQTDPPGVTGFCYVDPEVDGQGENLVADCLPSERRLLHFVGDETPKNDASMFIACGG